jgi:Zn ribbon nucleic-acid-binding protein
VELIGGTMPENIKKSTPVLVLVFAVAILGSLLFTQPVEGQSKTPAGSPEFTLNVQRTFGYSSGNGNIRGNFRLTVIGPEENIQQVVILLDDQPIGTVTQAPFQMDIQTQNFPEGSHTLSAEVTTLEGTVQRVSGGTFNFISSQQQWSGMFGIIAAIFGVIVFVVAIGILFSYLSTGKSVKDLPAGAERKYVISGGGVCPNCRRPFAFHWWGLNLVGYKYDRCDYCGRFNKVKRLSREELREAEQAELVSGQQAQPPDLKSPEEKYKEMLDQSRYTD